MTKLPIKSAGRRFRRSRAGNVSMMFALILPVLIFAVGMAVDYTRAASVRTSLNAAADAAVLAALTPAMLQQSNSVAQAAAENMFNAEIASLSSIIPGDTVLNVSVTNSASNPALRVVTLSYTVQSQTIFSGVLKTPSMGIYGTSTAQASVPPNIDFYLLLDNSPSMSLPATSAGITAMQTATSMQYSGAGCAFACHQASTNNGDTQGNPCLNKTTGVYSTPTESGGYCTAAEGTQISNYDLARKDGITLRLDELSSAVSTLMTTATQTASSGQFSTPPNYRFAAYQMDGLWEMNSTNTQLMALTSNYVSGWATASANFGVMEMYSNSNGCANAACSSGVSFNDIATNYDNAMSSINATMPNPGNGTNVAGDTPQEVLFFVTDGVEDEQNGSRLIQPINYGTSTNYCTKSRIAGSRSRFFTPSTCLCRPTASMSPTSSRSSPTSDPRCRPAPRRTCSTTRRSAPTSGRP